MNLAAYTPPGGQYPPFVSINLVDGKVGVIVRSPRKADGTCGMTACIELPPEKFYQLLCDAARRLNGAV